MRNLVGMSAASVELANKLLDAYDIGTHSRFLDGPVDFTSADEVDLAMFLSKCEEFVRTWPRPIPVSDQMPSDGQRALAYVPDVSADGRDDGYWISATWAGGRWLDGGLDRDGDETYERPQDVTHWLPMPPRPGVTDVQ